jgi:hypothetical protein
MKESIFLHWSRNLVGRAEAFSFNVMVSLLGGVLYSFSIVASPWMLLFFGVALPAIFTLCTYASIKNFAENSPAEGFPKFLSGRYGSHLAMAFDLTIIVILALLIYTNILNYLFFRLLQTVFFPLMSLSVLRFLHIVSK